MNISSRIGAAAGAALVAALCASTALAATPAPKQPEFTRETALHIIGNLHKIVSPHGIAKQLEISIGGAKQ